MSHIIFKWILLTESYYEYLIIIIIVPTPSIDGIDF